MLLKCSFPGLFWDLLILQVWNQNTGICIFRKPRVSSSQHTTAFDRVPCGLSDLAPSLFSFPTSHTNSDCANKVAVSPLHIINLKSLMNPIWLWGCGKRWMALNLPKITLLLSLSWALDGLLVINAQLYKASLFSSLRWHPADG